MGFIRKDKALPESLRPVEASPKLVSVPESAKTEISVKKNANPYGGGMSCREVFK
ncbi:MAG: hypothetical protein IPM97_00115 [Bdellovibrionaceae bacterium]|nr:hypothetical protein [Pseudobdellovibrionaceae bacterium]